MVQFSPGVDLVEARGRLRTVVHDVVEKLRTGVLPSRAECEKVDCKEEAGRRGRGGILLKGEPHNQEAARQLANEVACMANTPGGGALLVGVEDRTGQLLGAALDVDWLRQRVYQLVGVAPAAEEMRVDGSDFWCCTWPKHVNPWKTSMARSVGGRAATVSRSIGPSGGCIDS